MQLDRIRQFLQRSALTLKGLTYGPTGALIAAAGILRTGTLTHPTAASTPISAAPIGVPARITTSPDLQSLARRAI